MAAFAYPTDRLYEPASFLWGERVIVRDSGDSPLSANVQTVETPYSHRWTARMTLRRTRTFAERAGVEALFARLTSQADRLTMHNLAHPAPYGTMRGAPTLLGARSQGSTSIQVQSVVGATLLPGDFIGVTTTAAVPIQVVRVVVGGTANAFGVFTVTTAPALRANANDGALVVWDRPAVYWRLVSASGAEFLPGEAAPMVVELIESTV
jgi:hypothetical protein